MNKRPDGWDKGECEGCKRRIDDEFGEFFCDISCGEHTAQVNREAGADAMLKAIMEVRPSDSEIRIKIIETLYGGSSVPELEKWLKERLLVK